MAGRPIVFSGPMVHALLDGCKTQTRRVIKLGGCLPQFCGGRCDDKNDPSCWGWEDSDKGEWVTLDRFRDFTFVPYRAGDRLWVREAWRTTDSLDNLSPAKIGAAALEAGYRDPWCPYVTEADRVAHNWGEEDRGGSEMFGGFSDTAGRLRPGMHMPRWASRLTLTVTDVRVQRVQEISREDCAAEGCDGWMAHDQQDGQMPEDQFRKLWNSLNEPRGYGWDANPWVAAYTFTVARHNIDQETSND